VRFHCTSYKDLRDNQCRAPLFPSMFFDTRKLSRETPVILSFFGRFVDYCTSRLLRVGDHTVGRCMHIILYTDDTVILSDYFGVLFTGGHTWREGFMVLAWLD
jgi:hypothetical protein